MTLDQRGQEEKKTDPICARDSVCAQCAFVYSVPVITTAQSDQL